MDLTNRQQLISYLQEHGLYTKKSLGQNFLVDRKALDKIVAAAELSNDDCVIEVGPGLGTLTRELVGRAGKVKAVEKDDRLAQLLHCSIAPLLTPSSLPLKRGGNSNSTIQQFSNLEIINADILKLNLKEILASSSRYKVVANIPYYITSKILRFFLEAEKKPSAIVLLTQKEVAERICAAPGEMSVLSVSVQYYGQPEIIDIVPKESFFPVPEVDSAILRIANIRHQISSIKMKEGDLFRCARIGFASRRKTLLNNLSAGYQMDKKTTLGILEKVRLSDKTRAQELPVEKWQELCNTLNSNLKNQNAK